MEAEIEWRELPESSKWKTWGEMPMCDFAELDFVCKSEDMVYANGNRYIIDFGFYGHEEKLVCRIVKINLESEERWGDWENPVEKKEFSNGHEAYEYALEMMEKYD